MSFRRVTLLHYFCRLAVFLQHSSVYCNFQSNFHELSTVIQTKIVPLLEEGSIAILPVEKASHCLLIRINKDHMNFQKNYALCEPKNVLFCNDNKIGIYKVSNAMKWGFILLFLNYRIHDDKNLHT